MQNDHTNGTTKFNIKRGWHLAWERERVSHHGKVNFDHQIN